MNFIARPSNEEHRDLIFLKERKREDNTFEKKDKRTIKEFEKLNHNFRDESMDLPCNKTFTSIQNSFYAWEHEDEMLLQNLRSQDMIMKIAGQYHEEGLLISPNNMDNECLSKDEIDEKYAKTKFSPIESVVSEYVQISGSKEKNTTNLTPKKNKEVFSPKEDKKNLNLSTGIPKTHKSSTDSQEIRFSEFSALLDKREKELLKPIYFNVLVAGESGLGKSTFIDAFLNRKFKKLETIRSPTKDFQENIATRKEGKINFVLKLIDSPGYNDRKKVQKDWYKSLKKFILSKFRLHKENERLRNNLYASRDSKANCDIVDERIHCCLYFLSGPRIKVSDVLYMKKLQKYLNIIPILAKGDCYTPEEIKEIKKNLVKEAQEYDLEWFDCISALKERPMLQQELNEGPFGVSPPFLIISSAQKIQIQPNKVVFGRRYNWGVCNIEDPTHSDFLLLYNLLIAHLSINLIKITDYYYDRYFQLKRKKEKKLKRRTQEKKIGVGVGAALVVGVLGTIIAFKNKLLNN